MSLKILSQFHHELSVQGRGQALEGPARVAGHRRILELGQGLLGNVKLSGQGLLSQSLLLAQLGDLDRQARRKILLVVSLLELRIAQILLQALP